MMRSETLEIFQTAMTSTTAKYDGVFIAITGARLPSLPFSLQGMLDPSLTMRRTEVRGQEHARRMGLLYRWRGAPFLSHALGAAPTNSELLLIVPADGASPYRASFA